MTPVPLSLPELERRLAESLKAGLGFAHDDGWDHWFTSEHDGDWIIFGADGDGIGRADYEPTAHIMVAARNALPTLINTIRLQREALEKIAAQGDWVRCRACNRRDGHHPDCAAWSAAAALASLSDLIQDDPQEGEA